MPWGVRSRVKKDLLNKAQKSLDDDHYGLEKVKERIVEYLAVQQRSRKLKGPDHVFGGPSRRRAKPRSENPWPKPRGASSFASLWVGCAMKAKFGDTAGPTSAPCRVRSSRR